MKIQTSTLRKITELLISNLEELNINEIEIPYEYYWFIPKEQNYDVSKQPKPIEFTVGHIPSEWNDLVSIANNKRPPTSYHLVWVSSIFRAVGETVIG